MFANKPADDTVCDIFITHRQRLISIAFNITGNTECANDIVQDAYLKLSAATDKTHIDNLYSYCCRVVRNLALDHYRRQSTEAKYRVYSDDGNLPQAHDINTPDRELYGLQLMSTVEKLLKNLPNRTRHAFELHRFSGLTQRQVANQLDCSATLVNFMLRDANEALAGCREQFVEAYH